MGGFSGRLGNVVVYEMFGKTVVRSLPQKNQKKATGKRKQYQDDFRYVMKWMQYLKPMIDKCWLPEPPHQKAFKPAFSHHLKRYREMDRPNKLEWIQLTKGGLEGFGNTEMYFDGELLQLKWSNVRIEEPSNLRDTVYIQLTNPTKGRAHEHLIATERQDGRKEIAVSSWEKGDRIVAFMVAASSNNPGLFSKTYCVEISN